MADYQWMRRLVLGGRETLGEIVAENGGGRIALDRLYKLYREKIVHEDLLVHNRMMWLLVPESFLLTTFGTIGAVMFRIIQNHPNFVDPIFVHYRVVEIALAFVGLALAVFSLSAIIRADKAITLLRQSWDVIWKEGDPNPSLDKLPYLTGGGKVKIIPYWDENTKKMINRKVKIKLSFPVAIPTFFTVFWCVILLALIFPNVPIWLAAHLPSIPL